MMQPLLVFSLIILFIMLLMGNAFLLVLALRDQKLAVARRRSLYEKSSCQVGQLAVGLNLFLLVLVGSDLIFQGAFIQALPGPWAWLGHGITLDLAAALFFCLLYMVLRGKTGFGFHRILARLALVCNFKAAVFALILFWSFLNNSLYWDEQQPFIDLGTVGFIPNLEQAKSFFPPLLRQFNQWVPCLFFVTWLLVGAPMASGLTLIWQFLRRSSDDFGRDYYVFAANLRNSQAAYSGALFLLFSAVLLFLAPQYSIDRLPDLALPFLSLPLDTIALVLNSGVLCMALAEWCWYFPLRKQNPLRYKTLLCLAPLLGWLGLVSLMARFWN